MIMKKLLLVLSLALISNFSFSQTDTLTAHFPDFSDTLFPVGSGGGVWGFISGHHAFTDLAKVQKFDTNYGVPATGDYEIRSILFWIAAKEGTNANSFSFAGVWEEDANGRPSLNTFIDHETVQLDVDTSSAGLMHIDGNAYYNAVATFVNPIAVPASRMFWAGLELTINNFNNHEYVWLKTTEPGSFADTTYVMDQWSDGIFRGINTWSNVKSFSFAIFPVIGPRRNPNDTTDLRMVEVFSPNSVDSLSTQDNIDLEYVIENTGNHTLNAGLSYNLQIDWDINTDVVFPSNLPRAIAAGEKDTIPMVGSMPVPDTIGTFPICLTVKTAFDVDNTNDSVCSSIKIVEPPNTTGLGVFKSPELSFYPNPAKNDLKIEMNAEFDRISLTDVTGRVLLTKDVSGVTSLDLDINEFPSGSYFITVHSPTINKSYQFLKQ